MTRRKIFKSFLASLLIILFASCEEPVKEKGIAGLWLVDNVQIEDQEMTPQARWMQFNEDGTQNSGNGWYRHSVGTYDYNEESKTLRIVNTNGYEEPFEDFKVDLTGDQMLWTRVEDGSEVQISLSRINDIQPRLSDELIGVWKVKSVMENDKDVTSEYDPKGKRYIYFNWNGGFRDRNGPNGFIGGFYQPSAHSQEVELLNRDGLSVRYSFDINENSLTMENISDSTLTKLTFERINYFPTED